MRDPLMLKVGRAIVINIFYTVDPIVNCDKQRKKLSSPLPRPSKFEHIKVVNSAKMSEVRQETLIVPSVNANQSIPTVIGIAKVR